MNGRIRNGRAWIPVMVLVAAGLLFGAAPPAGAQGGIAGSIGNAVSSIVNSATGATFTITKIDARSAAKRGQAPEARGERQSVAIHFSERCRIEDLRRNLKFIPPVPLQWNTSTVTDQNVLLLMGQFKPGQRYVVVLPPAFKSANGKTYAKGIAAFTMADRDPEIAFYEQGSVIERNSMQMLHVQLMNVNEVLISGLQIPPVMVPAALRLAAGSPNANWDASQAEIMRATLRLKEALQQDADFRPIVGDAFAEQQLFFSSGEKNVFHQFSIPLSFRRDKERGSLEIVRVRRKGAEQDVQTPFRLFRITDLGLTYKLADDGLLVWATSLYSGKPVSDVSLFGFTNAQEVVSLGRTEGSGMMTVRNGRERKRASLRSGSEGQVVTRPVQLGEIVMIAAVSRDDRTYVEIVPQGNVRPEGIQQQRQGQKSMPLLKGHVFTERGIYRPGDTVQFKGTVRQYRDGVISAPSATTAFFRIVNSKGEEIYSRTIALSEFGTAIDKSLIKTFFPLGTYTLSMRYGPDPGSDQTRKAAKKRRHGQVQPEPEPEQPNTVSRTFEVQEFRQPRHYVEILYKPETKKDDSYVNLERQKEMLNCEITGKYYAGGPVKHGKVRWSIYHTKTDYPRQDHQGYTFGYPLDARTELIESGESMLNEKGTITVPVPVSKDTLAGKYGIEVTAAVVDFDGRVSSDSSVYQADPEYLVGISNHPALVKPGEAQSLSAIVIDRKGSKVTRGDVLVQVMERGYTHIQKRNAEGYLYHEQQQVWRSQLSAELPIKDDRAVFDFDFTRGGEYLISFTYKTPAGRQYTSATKYSMPGYYYGYEFESGQRGQPQNYGKLSLYPEKPLYASGESMKIYLNPSREISTCLVTVEQAGLLEHSILELKPGQRFIELPVKDSYNPNVYVSVVATVPRSAFPVYTAQFDTEAPSFLFGTVNVEVKGGQQKIKIAVNEEQKKIKSLPGAEMALSIATTDQDGRGLATEVALAVIDESILSMTGYETPTLDALAKFLVPLGVFTGDLRLDLLKQTPYGFFRNAPLTGGDGDESAGPDAVTSKVRKDFNPVAYFNPSIRTDASGRATVTVKFPDTMTTYRIYAVACDKGSRFGSYQRPALVVKDFYMEPGLPAFMTRGDRFRFSISAFNKTDRAGSVDFTVASDRFLSLTTTGKSFSLPGFDRTLIPVDGTAQQAGVSTVRFSGTFKELSDTVETTLPVNSGFVLGNGLQFGSFRKDVKISYDLPKAVRELRWEDVGPDDVKAILTVSGSPFLRMAPGLRYFLRYPYGCVEQTSSGVLPIAAMRDILQKGLMPDISTAETDKFIKPGIERLFSMQTEDGGFGYWPGDRVTNKWGTIYAMNALTRAGLAGYELPKERMDRALAYLKDQIKGSGREEFTFRGFSAYILALNKVLDRESFIKVMENIDNQPREAVMLALMAAKTGRMMLDDQIRSRLRTVLERPWLLGRISDEFYARYREPAISLLAATMVFPGEEIAERLAAKLLSGMNQEGIWTSTSDSGWSLAALSEHFGGSKSGAQPATVTVTQAGKAVDSFTLDPKSYRTIALDAREFVKNPAFSIAANNDQTLLYKLALTFPRTDYARTGYSNGFEIHKTIKNTDGTNTIKVGDIVEVKLRINIKNPGGNYVVVDDPLPAGLVAINSAIKTEEQGVVAKKMKRAMHQQEDEGEGDGDDLEGEFGEGFGWNDWYWDPMGYYRFTPNFFEIRNDRVIAFRNQTWSGIYEYAYYARAVCEGEFVMPSSKIQLMYDPEVVAYTPQGKVVIKGNK
ncbi:MAG: alpha-2-macroglobulin family protein [Nitrospirota bacterium]